jgi:hypothetical protein
MCEPQTLEDIVTLFDTICLTDCVVCEFHYILIKLVHTDFQHFYFYLVSVFAVIVCRGSFVWFCCGGRREALPTCADVLRRLPWGSSVTTASGLHLHNSYCWCRTR